MSGDVHVQFCERPGVRFPRATHLAVLGKAPAAEMLAAADALMKRLKLTMNAEKNPQPPVAGGLDDVPRLPDWTQLPAGHRCRLHWHAPEPGERPEHLP